MSVIGAGGFSGPAGRANRIEEKHCERGRIGPIERRVVTHGDENDWQSEQWSGNADQSLPVEFVVLEDTDCCHAGDIKCEERGSRHQARFTE